MAGRVLHFLLAVMALVAWSGCRSDEEKVLDFIARGEAYFAEEKFPEAILEYKNALQIDPNQAPAHWGLATALLENRQTREGLWEVQETVRLDPSNLEARLRLGQLSTLAGKLDEGIEQADQVLALDPMNAQAQLLRAQALEAQEKFDDALAAYQSGLQLAERSPDEPAALRLIAGFHTRRGDLASATPYFEKRVEVAPDASSWIALGDHHQRENDPEAAEKAYRKATAVARPEERTRAYSALAGFLYDHDRVADGVKELQKGIAEVADPLDLTYLLARFYSLQGANELADQLVRDVAARTPGDYRPYLVLSAYEEGRGRLPEALAAVERALAIAPENPEARVWHAELLVDVGQGEGSTDRYAQARAVIEGILKSNPTDADALVARAKVDLIQERPQDALSALATAIEVRPSWAVPHYRSGSVHALLGDWSRARSELARALELDATLVEARKLLVRAHQSLGEHEYAIEAAQKYLRDRPDDSDVRTRLAESLFALGRREEARQALAPIPGDARTPEVHFALAQLALAAGRRDEGRVLLTQALEQRPNSPEVLQALLGLDTLEKKLDQSVARIRAALQAEPRNPRLHQLRGVAALASSDLAEAEAAFRHAFELDPAASSTTQQLADFYLRTGRAPEAIRTYEAALEKNAEQPQSHFRLAILYEQAGDRERAIALYEDAIEGDPKLAEAKNNLAFLLAESGTDLDRALELAQQARELLPNDPTTADTLGWVFFKRKLPATAIEYLREAESGRKDGDPERGTVRHHLALAYEADGKRVEAADIARRALRELEGIQGATAKGSEPTAPEPAWAGELRDLVKRTTAEARAQTSPSTSVAATQGT